VRSPLLARKPRPIGGMRGLHSRDIMVHHGRELLIAEVWGILSSDIEDAEKGWAETHVGDS
jgi:hypothetical protein